LDARLPLADLIASTLYASVQCLEELRATVLAAEERTTADIWSGEMKLTPYDEFPVHQASQPFSYVPSTDYNWDDGYYWGVFDPSTGVVLAVGLRVNPNTDMIGGYAMLNDRGRQFTVRFSRCWRRDFSLKVGPFTFAIIEPLKTMELRMDPNESGLSFGIRWEGTCPAYLEQHHQAEVRGRRTTDQSRYTQPGVADGFIKLGPKEYRVHRDSWTGARDHSWGLYTERPPLGPPKALLPPGDTGKPARAMHLWVPFQTPGFSGFLEHNEYPDGSPCYEGDVSSGAFNGQICAEWNSPAIKLAKMTHQFRYRPGTRIIEGATLRVVDGDGKNWLFEFVIPVLPFVPHTFGYFPGSWKDGGTFHTYHGSEELALEWDEIDSSVQPFRYTPYKVRGDAARDGFGFGFMQDEPIIGLENIAHLTLTAPDGSVHKGGAQVEHWVSGRYDPYGFK
jgi:hypothetical protein